jgi:hypothetical protein
VVNLGERYKRVTFTTYPDESKGAVNVVNVVRGFFTSSRTRHAKSAAFPSSFRRSLDSRVFSHPIARSPNHSIRLNSLLIPCSDAWETQKPAIHASFLKRAKKIPCYFPCYPEIQMLREIDRHFPDS